MAATPKAPKQFGVYVGGKWYVARVREAQLDSRLEARPAHWLELSPRISLVVGAGETVAANCPLRIAVDAPREPAMRLSKGAILPISATIRAKAMAKSTSLNFDGRASGPRFGGIPPPGPSGARMRGGGATPGAICGPPPWPGPKDGPRSKPRSGWRSRQRSGPGSKPWRGGGGR